MNDANTIKVWDPIVRLGHWLLVAGFISAYLSGEEWQSLHVLAGYTVLGVVLVRMVWGLIGTRHARFSNFVRAPSTVVGYLKDVLGFRARRYIGHNPAGGAMVMALLLSLLLTTVSGLAIYALEEGQGPLVPYLGQLGHFWEELFEEGHEFFANFSLLLVLLHVGGVLLASFQHQENLVRAMVTGRKELEHQ